jgi:hypothetical protein
MGSPTLKLECGIHLEDTNAEDERTQ